MKSVKWNFHIYDSQSNHMYDMMLGSDILSELKIDLYVFNHTIRGNIGNYKGFTTPMKDIENINH